MPLLTVAVIARKKQAPKDLTGIRQRGGTYQERIFGGHDPVTGSGALSAAMRWGWIAVNPLDAVKRPRQQHPQPDLPSAEEAARNVSAAWEQDADWGTFVWLTFVTGARRGELLGLVWEHLDLSAGLLTIRRNLVRQNGKTIIKDTKTHQMRIVSLDPDTIAISRDHKRRVAQQCAAIGTTLTDDAFVFSYVADHRRHCDPDGITHWYSRMIASLGLQTHLHALRHYSATELIAAGVDVRTIAGRLGHGGGGATTLRVYAAWMAAADKQAAGLLASRLPKATTVPGLGLDPLPEHAQ